MCTEHLFCVKQFVYVKDWRAYFNEAEAAVLEDKVVGIPKAQVVKPKC